MSKKSFHVSTVTRIARPRSKRMRESGVGTVSIVNNGSSSGGGSTCDGHSHTNKTALDAMTIDDQDYIHITQFRPGTSVSTKAKSKSGYADLAARAKLADEADHAKLADRATEADHADEADNADKWDGHHFDDYLDQPVRSTDRVTFDRVTMNGFQTPDFASGIAGVGGRMDSKGAAELDSLTLRRFLDVPELRYNRVDVTMGDKWCAPCAGIIKTVWPADQIIELKLEDGELGSVKAGDICMGIFHSQTPSQNADADFDDSRGNRRFSGFATTYFQIVEVLDAPCSKFRYQLRPASVAYPTQVAPCPAMTFVGFGSFTDPARRTSRYETRTYQRYLHHVADWEFTASNIAAQFGDLSNLSVHGLEMTGYSAYLNNIYMQGALRSLDNTFVIDSRTKSLMMALPESGMGLAFNPKNGLTLGKVYNIQTGHFDEEYDLDLIGSAAAEALRDVSAVTKQLTDWSSDAKISPTEKTALKQQRSDIQSEYAEVLTNAGKYSVGTQSYTDAYAAAIAAFAKYTASAPESISIEADYANIAAYYPARQIMLEQIAAASKAYSEKLVEGVQIGEVNLLTQSNIGWENSNYRTAIINIGNYKPKHGDECTIVIKAKLGINKEYFGIYNSGGQIPIIRVYNSNFNKDGIAVVTFKWVEGSNTSVYIYNFPSTIISSSKIEWVKLVAGNKTSHMWTSSPEDVQAEITAAQSTADAAARAGQAINDYVQALESDVNAEIVALNKRQDGKIDSYFEIYDPTLSNYPANEWTTEKIKEEHNGDSFTNRTTGKTWKWKIISNVWSWDKITNTVEEKMYADISKAQSTADGKMQNFVLKPCPPYSVGDTWTQGNEGDFMRCIVSRAAGVFEQSDWDKASKYTDDTVAKKAEADASAAQNTADSAKASGDAITAKLTDWVSDSMISPTEKTALKQQRSDIQSEYAEVLTNAGKYSVGTQSYTDAYAAAIAAFAKYTASAPESISIEADYANIAAYYPARQIMLEQIAAASKAYSEKLVDNRRETVIDATALDQNTYYPVTLTLAGAGGKSNIEVWADLNADTGNPVWGVHSSKSFSCACKWSAYGSGWGSRRIERSFDNYQYLWTADNIPPIGSIDQLGYSSNEFIYVRGGGKYRFRYTFADDPILHVGEITLVGETISPKTSVEKPITVQNIAADAMYAIAEMNNDGIFSLLEKQSIRTQWEHISGISNTVYDPVSTNGGSYIRTITFADALSVPTDGLVAAFTGLRTYLHNLDLYTGVNTPDFNRSEMAAKFTTYYDAETALANLVVKQQSLSQGDRDKNEMALRLGYASYADMVANPAIIDGGYVRAEVIKAEQLIARNLRTGLSGNRVEIIGDDKEIRVFDDAENMCVRVSGTRSSDFVPAANKVYKLLTQKATDNSSGSRIVYAEEDDPNGKQWILFGDTSTRICQFNKYKNSIVNIPSFTGYLSIRNYQGDGINKVSGDHPIEPILNNLTTIINVKILLFHIDAQGSRTLHTTLKDYIYNSTTEIPQRPIISTNAINTLVGEDGAYEIVLNISRSLVLTNIRSSPQTRIYWNMDAEVSPFYLTTTLDTGPSTSLFSNGITSWWGVDKYFGVLNLPGGDFMRAICGTSGFKLNAEGVQLMAKGMYNNVARNYIRSTDGLMIQWGTIAPGAGSQVYFPTSFYTMPISITISPVSYLGDHLVGAAGVYDLYAGSFKYWRRETDGANVANSGFELKWIAIGRWR